ncbi:MAG: hypothetical protein HY926_15555 [Elusimicrobia bacterium]|nr:hypothetical protein [Elusimicrobiota bacterium]
MIGRLVASGWLRRVVEFELDGQPVRVEYNGRGMGYESVLVDGRVAKKTRSYPWFVPRFYFQVRGRPAKAEVRVWPWCTLRRLRISVDEETAYQEPTNWWDLATELGVTMALVCAALILAVSHRPPTAGTRAHLPPVEASSQ